jgi:hypothetical protein
MLGGVVSPRGSGESQEQSYGSTKEKNVEEQNPDAETLA